MRLAIAASFTLANALCGFAAVLVLAELPPMTALPTTAVLIYVAWAFDMVDGVIARRLGVAGPFGAMLDSLCDAITFGLVPAFAVVVASREFGPAVPFLGHLIGAVYLIGALVRLARFTAAATTADARPPQPPKYRLFSGLSSTGAAMAVSAFLLAWPPASLGVALLCGGLMISSVRYPDLGHIYLTRALPSWHLIAPIALAVVVGPVLALAAGFALYLLLGPVLGGLLLRRMNAR